MNSDYSSALEHASLTLCPDHVFFVYSANMAGDGQFMLIGPERFIVRLLEKLKGACSLRGGGRGRRMQGKFSGLVEPAVVIEAAWEGVASHEAD